MQQTSAVNYPAQAYGAQAQANAFPKEALPPQSPMKAHASDLHDMAERLASLNGQLCSVIERITGPAPETGSGAIPVPTDPAGALLVAQFGATRIRQSLDRLSELVMRLDGIA